MARQTKTRQPARSGAAPKSGGPAAPAEPARKKSFNPFKFLREVRQEGRKVTWTSRQETIISTIMVVIMASLAALFFFGVDSLISLTIDFLLALGA